MTSVHQREVVLRQFPIQKHSHGSFVLVVVVASIDKVKRYQLVRGIARECDFQDAGVLRDDSSWEHSVNCMISLSTQVKATLCVHVVISTFRFLRPCAREDSSRSQPDFARSFFENACLFRVFQEEP